MGKEEKQKKESWKVEFPIEESIDSNQDYIGWSKRVYRINEDLIGHLMVYDDIEKVSELEWINFWKEVKAAKIKLRKIVYVQYRKKHVKIFEKSLVSTKIH